LETLLFSPDVYQLRRNKLRELVGDGLILFLGNSESSYNYQGNTYSFRQDSNFLYFFGIDQADLLGLIDCENGKEILAGEDVSIEDTVWTGAVPSVSELAALCGAANAMNMAAASTYIHSAINQGKLIHFVKPYRAENTLLLQQLTGFDFAKVQHFVSKPLIHAIASLRLIKEPREIAEIEKMIGVAYRMHTTAMKMAKAGVIERDIAAAVEGIALSGGGSVPFPVICSVRGEVLHNHHHYNTLQEGQLLLTDAGAESFKHYASDITRTVPVSGRFSMLQRDIYSIVLSANMAAINAIKAGVFYKDVHLIAARVIAEGLSQMGIMKGNCDDAVAVGAHGFFFVHGIGHQLGLDVHDLEGLGENNFAYDSTVERSAQFGTAYLRYGKKVEEGMVLTVEPGIYFIPQLFAQWKAEKRFDDFINYSEVEKLLGFGGIRIEDNVLVTAQGSKVLGVPIPKSVEDVERMALS
jgi:Xaa-Pro aminopeptidase